MRLFIIMCCALQQVRSSYGNRDETIPMQNPVLQQMAKMQQNDPKQTNALNSPEIQLNEEEEAKCIICYKSFLKWTAIKNKTVLYCEHPKGEKDSTIVQHVVECDECFESVPYTVNGKHYNECNCPYDRCVAKWYRPVDPAALEKLKELLIDVETTTGNVGVATVQTIMSFMITVLSWVQTEYRALYTVAGEYGESMTLPHLASRPSSNHVWMFQEATRDGITFMLFFSVAYLIDAWLRNTPSHRVRLMPRLEHFKKSKFFISWFVLQFSTYVLNSFLSPFVAVIFGLIFVSGVLFWQFVPKDFRPLDSWLNHYIHHYPQAYWDKFKINGLYMLNETAKERLLRDVWYITSLTAFVSTAFALSNKALRVEILPKIGKGFKFAFIVAITTIWIIVAVCIFACEITGKCPGSNIPDFSSALNIVENTDWHNTSLTGASSFWGFMFLALSAFWWFVTQFYIPLKNSIAVLTFQRLFITGSFMFMVDHSSAWLLTILFYFSMFPMGTVFSYIVTFFASFGFSFCCCFCGGCGCGCGCFSKFDPDRDDCSEPCTCRPCGWAPWTLWWWGNRYTQEKVDAVQNRLLNV